jgi:hypothetical protein
MQQENVFNFFRFMLRTRRVRALNLGGKETDTGGSLCQCTYS